MHRGTSPSTVAAVTRCPRRGGCKDRKVLAHHPGSRCPRLKGQQGQFLPRPFSSACGRPASPCLPFHACPRPHPLSLRTPGPPRKLARRAGARTPQRVYLIPSLSTQPPTKSFWGLEPRTPLQEWRVGGHSSGHRTNEGLSRRSCQAPSPENGHTDPRNHPEREPPRCPLSG